jgi:RimJ/RimL family protein N-acetyltransferase
MTLTVREMMASEVDVIIEYFQSSTPEHLEMLGVDPTRFPPATSGRERLRRESALPIEQRNVVLVIWLSDDQPIGFSTSDKISYGEQANMHLHVLDPGRRQQGVGAECVRGSVELYFEKLKLKRLFCEPHAAEGRVQISQDAYDRAGTVQFSSSRNAVGDRALDTRATPKQNITGGKP